MVKWYPTEDSVVLKKKGPKPHTPIRGNITPGQVLILLAGKHQGKRVVFLKQLESGLLLVTGPYKLNGVPLKRIPQSYTIPTSVKVNISGAEFESIADQYFSPERVKKNKDEEAFFTAKKEKPFFSEAKKMIQANLDSVIVSNIKEALVKKYLSTRFRLRNGMYPHSLKF